VPLLLLGPPFKKYIFLVHHPVNRDDRHLLANATSQTHEKQCFEYSLNEFPNSETISTISANFWGQKNSIGPSDAFGNFGNLFSPRSCNRPQTDSCFFALERFHLTFCPNQEALFFRVYCLRSI
jgi:hypothetical protein